MLLHPILIQLLHIIVKFSIPWESNRVQKQNPRSFPCNGQGLHLCFWWLRISRCSFFFMRFVGFRRGLVLCFTTTDSTASPKIYSSLRHFFWEKKPQSSSEMLHNRQPRIGSNTWTWKRTDPIAGWSNDTILIKISASNADFKKRAVALLYEYISKRKKCC